ncbi:MAG: helix-hairpin-helix domain-containing protein, partial [Nitrososphaerales archaeon]
ALYNAGYRDLRKLKAASTRRLAEVEKIGPAVAKKIKEQLSS